MGSAADKAKVPDASGSASAEDSSFNPPREDWVRLSILGVVLFLVYSANGRPIGALDTMPTTFLPVAIIRGDGPFLDRFQSTLEKEDGSLPLHCTWSRGHIVSRYPVGPALMAVPLVLPQVLIVDWLYPGWEQETPYRCFGMAKNASAAIVALLGVALFKLLRMVGVCRMALPAVFAAALGSNLWTVASQSLWQHGPAALALTLSVILLLPPTLSRTRLYLAGLTTAALVCFRSVDVIFALAIFFWMIRHQPRGLVWFLPFPVLGAVALAGYHYWYFGSIVGGQRQLESLHPALHGFDGAWSGSVLEGALGTLVSPSHGLFVYTPWIALALPCLPAVASKYRDWPLLMWLMWAILPYLFVHSKYSVWWGGHCFGPRYWTDIMPLFAVLLGFSLEWSVTRSRLILLALCTVVVLSLGVQLIGAFCYPSSWETSPVNVDLQHDRLWDWRDTELSRCLREGITHMK